MRTPQNPTPPLPSDAARGVRQVSLSGLPARATQNPPVNALGGTTSTTRPSTTRPSTTRPSTTRATGDVDQTCAARLPARAGHRLAPGHRPVHVDLAGLTLIPPALDALDAAQHEPASAEPRCYSPITSVGRGKPV